MLNVLGYPTKYLHYALQNSDGNFHRKKPKTSDEDLYDETFREIVDKHKGEIYLSAIKRKSS